jgi:hypothetical protein
VLYAPTYGRAAWRLPLGPGARITGPSSVQAGHSAVYDGSQSRAYGGAALTYQWTLPDGSHASGPTVSFHATSPGTKTLTLVVTAPDGRQGTTTKTITVTPGPGGPGFALLQLQSKRVRLHRDRTYRLVFSCPSANAHACAGTLKVTASIRKHVRGLGAKTFGIPSGRRATIKLRMSRAVKRLLRHRKRLTATITIRQLDAAGIVHHERLRVRIVLRR